MNVFKNVDFKHLPFRIDESTDSDYHLMCIDFGKMVSRYHVNQDIHSEQFWAFLKEKFKITEDNVIIKSEVNFDEKNKEHKYFKYYVKIPGNHKESTLYFVFYDEFRNLDDEDYIDFATSADKSDKITGLQIYYDSTETSFTEIEENIINVLKDKVYNPSKQNQFFIITVGVNGYELRASYVRNIDIDIESNYGKKFVEIDKKIIEHLQNKKHGLFLFHGEPGLGKTFYIRRIIRALSEKKTLLYIPPYMMYNIVDPEFISFISKLKNIIIILEDSENIISNDVEERTQAVSNILNMSDGLLNDVMDVQIIATFNKDIKKMDPALTRAGRLIVNYKFKKLSAEEANKLCKKLKNGKKFDKAVTLAEIYEGSNQIIVDDLEDNTKKIGFKI